ncbi:hypothetical protein GCM10007385_26300 [Tateyamaria omphalii]|uniref:hypothetical protein n=1 Tax=Tateyamaria omphalii TaxID=299262 RepID=UPI001671DA75|nr:hypothetical protein [Tateyamaria omphalii]GGX56340.1 hypothetical protein GCM10007385_26300 [Tateyamaria omphalii]
MDRVLWIVGIYLVGLGILMWTQPQLWYSNTPGVAPMRPFNMHFVRDFALVFGTSGLAVLYAARSRNHDVLIVGLSWLALHALYHLVTWANRGFAFDLVAFVNLLGIQLPVWTCLAIAFSMQPKEQTS